MWWGVEVCSRCRSLEDGARCVPVAVADAFLVYLNLMFGILNSAHRRPPVAGIRRRKGEDASASILSVWKVLPLSVVIVARNCGLSRGRATPAREG